MDEETKKPEESTTEDTGEGSESETDEATKRLDAENERMEKAIKKKEDLIAKNKELMAKESLGGKSEAGAKPPEKKKLTDEEYAEALERGEVDPLKEDGIVS